MITLVPPSLSLHSSWWEAAQEFNGARLHGFSVHGFEHLDLGSPEGFGPWLALQQRTITDPPEGWVPATMFWIIDDAQPQQVLGSLSFRHELNDFLREEGGHIGYGVRPSARGRGVATAALEAALAYAPSLGLDRVLVTCDEDNEPSRKTIERCGGVLEDIRSAKRRCWIDCAA
ncbi:GNAT family N-acetyltransferase [Demetria terragena]|uniref:GNAT family N-acetyltransferase n=1 Tax=Demetria terragena TaxID=63959 RepID=UPI00037EB568|nr:GNAT family N-acetyltransferase [Demetria terragena]